MGKNRLVYLLLGSNLGNMYANFNTAKGWVEEKIAPIVQTSSLYQTKAWGLTEQPDFLNQVIVINTDLAGLGILEKLQKIEKKMGRTKSIHWGPRIIDIDILWITGEVFQEPNLIVPHPRLLERNFALIPLIEVAPQLLHPVLQQSLSALAKTGTDNLELKKIEE